jgi:uncharacterized protein with GYD domain
MGALVPTYMLSGAYSSGSWARLMRVVDDRSTAVNELMHSLGGSLEIVYWEVSARAVHAIVDLPDSSTAAAAAGVLSQTGAFKSIEVEEVLTQTQFTEVLALAGNVFETFRVPGQAMLNDDSSMSPSRVRGLLRTLSGRGQPDAGVRAAHHLTARFTNDS